MKHFSFGVIPLNILFQRTAFGIRKNLIIIRDGGNSLHRNWLRDIKDSQRNWDICVSYYGDNSNYDRTYEDFIISQKSFKYDAIHDLVLSFRLDSFYNNFWLIDDDIDCSWGQINKLFEIVDFYGLELSQPALTPDSYFSHQITRQNSKTYLRFSNFVEAMIPLFSKNALSKCLPTFKGSISAFGLDLVWSNLLSVAPNKIAIIDAVTVHHTRPVGSGSFYKIIGDMNIDPHQEMMENLRRFCGKSFQIKEYGFITEDGYTSATIQI